MSKRWTADDIPSLKGKTFLVTGANSGLGLETAKQLAKKDAYVIMTVRSREKGESAMDEVKSVAPSAEVKFMLLDLADLGSVKSMANQFKAEHDKLDVLINNAGVMYPPERKETKDGFELQFGVNHLGHFALTTQLLDPLKKASDARVVTISSMAAKMRNADIYWEDIQWKKNYDKTAAYAQSKLANQLFAIELQRRLIKKELGIKSVMAHPGYTATNLQRHLGFFGKIMNFLLAQSTEKGALPQLRAATDPEVEEADYYGPKGILEWRGYPTKVKPNPVVQESEKREKLWKLSEELVDRKLL